MKKLELRELLETRELLERIDEVLRLIKEEGETIELTDHGETIAKWVPVSEPEEAQESIEEKDSAAWAKLRKIAEDLDPYWPKDVDAVEIVRDVRRDL